MKNVHCPSCHCSKYCLEDAEGNSCNCMLCGVTSYKDHNCLEEAERLGRANYRCKVCKKDVTMRLLYIYDLEQNLIKLRGKNEKKLEKFKNDNF